MIKCFVVLCAVANPDVCLPQEEITPTDHVVTSPMECLRGGGVMSTTKDPQWFLKIYGRMEGDGSDIVQTWLRDQKAKRDRTEPQIK